jgi:hypothetical protein
MILVVPCLTLRENTERPVTATEGTNREWSEPARSADFSLSIHWGVIQCPKRKHEHAETAAGAPLRGHDLANDVCACA